MNLRINKAVTYTAIFLCIVLINVLSSPFSAYSSDDNETTKIAFILPLSGMGALWGEHTKNGALLAYKNLSESLRNRLQLIFEDDQLMPSKTISAYRRVLETNKIDLVVLFGPQAGNAVVPLSERKRIPSITITADERVVAERQYAMRHWVSAPEIIKKLNQELVRQNLTRIAVVGTTQDAILDIMTRVKKTGSSNGIEIVFSEDFPVEEKDFKAHILKIRSLKPDGILIFLLPGQLSSFLKQLHDLKVESKLFGIGNIENSSELKASEGLMEGIIYVGPKLSKNFTDKYQATYQMFPEIAASNAYDIVMMATEALKKGARGSEQINSYLHSLENFSGSMGNYGLERGANFNLPAQLKIVRSGKFEPFQP